ncbi:UDP-forming cellulose synthase catalytic subunit [Labrys sp. LIt4]|uniref:UDP-forming cellulose synthase catalytic subunit n=1 Tax=Labrys sp. LIt4 TaxID=2821355 RepID=UPI001ADFD906|nr:UDP-forming cellulose synthase catalytic subunit [Labrys sp. LIt4]MBP0582606.1 UDP-forming cellulose synthase catalytic subunit [Labrys sp. LIt4]
MTKALVVLFWLLTSLFVLVLVTLPISQQTHLIAGTTVVIAMALLKAVKPTGVWRLIALALGTSIVLRYVYWRTTSTLPPINQPENFIVGLIVYLAEMYCVAMLALSLFVVATPLPSRVAPRLRDDELPSVDVFIPSYNEGAELLAGTLAAALGMDYPPDKLHVYLLDDGGTEQKRNSKDLQAAVEAQQRHARLKRLCEELGANYLTRARNEHAKAGNLNNGLAHSSSDIVVVFDADHAPARDFLHSTVGFFRDDPSLFMVQTPHFFLNPDPIERNLRTFQKMPSENEMFYGIIQRGLDKWNSSFFCGSAAALRRSALEATEGFKGRSITEDCETAMELHARGWHSIYVDKPLIAGLQPATFASFIGQRSRWAQGMVQILLFQRPFMKRGLKISQRLCYMSSILFWFFPLARLVFLVAPLFYLFFNLEIFVASGQEFLSYTLSYMLVNLMMQNYLYGSYRWPWISELYEYAQTLYLLPALASVIMHPTKPTFRVTAKDDSVQESRLSEIAWPLFAFFCVLIAGMGMTVFRLIEQPYKADVTLVVGMWNLLNVLLAGCALGVVSERGERQSSQRVRADRRCELILGDTVIPAMIENVSTNGAGISIVGAVKGLERESLLRIRFTPLSRLDGRPELPVVVRRVSAGAGSTTIGVRFQTSDPIHFRLVADLLYATSDRWTAFQAARRYNPGILRGTIWFYALALKQTVRGLIYLYRASVPARADSPVPQQRAGEPT